MKKRTIIQTLNYLVFGCMGIISLFSCSQKEGTTVITDFPLKMQLKASVVQLPAPIYLPRHIGVFNDILFVYKEKEEQLFDFYKLPDCIHLGSFGNRGAGPDDFGLLDTRSFESTQKGFRVMQAGSNLLKTIEFDGSRLSVVQSEKMFENYPSNNGFYPLGNNGYLTLGDINGTKEYRVFNNQSGVITDASDYPQWVKWEDFPSKPPAFITYIKSCVVHPDKELFASFYARFKRFRIYDLSANLLVDADVRIEPYTLALNEDVRMQPVYYTGQPFATDRYIYVLCANTDGNHPDAPPCPELHIFDWDGKAVGCYAFDRRVDYMVVSPQHKRIYTLNNQKENELYVYDLPNL